MGLHGSGRAFHAIGPQSAGSISRADGRGSAQCRLRAIQPRTLAESWDRSPVVRLWTPRTRLGRPRIILGEASSRRSITGVGNQSWPRSPACGVVVPRSGDHDDGSGKAYACWVGRQVWGFSAADHWRCPRGGIPGGICVYSGGACPEPPRDAVVSNSGSVAAECVTQKYNQEIFSWQMIAVNSFLKHLFARRYMGGRLTREHPVGFPVSGAGLSYGFLFSPPSSTWARSRISPRPRPLVARFRVPPPSLASTSPREHSSFLGSRGNPCSGRKCLPFKVVPASRLVIRT